MVSGERRRPRVVVVGSYAVGLVMRAAHIPAPGETVLGRDFQAMDGGKGSNQAVACARLGAETVFLAALGDDAYGDRGIALLDGAGVDTALVRRVTGTPTGAGFITVDDAGDNAISVDLGANLSLSCEDIDRAEQVIARADVLLAQLEIAPEVAVYAAALARRHGVHTILNPAPAQPLPPGGLAHVDVLTPNLAEARTLSGLAAAEAPELAEALREAGAATVVLTLGEQGAWIAHGAAAHAVHAYEVEAVDTTGAGDAFSAALAVALAEGRSLDAAVRFACAAGAYCVRSLGTVPSYATREELTQFIEGSTRSTGGAPAEIGGA